MNKSELTARVAEETGLTQAQARRAVDALFDSISRALKRGDKVSLAGFGAFSARERAARVARNPRTGAPVTIKAGKTPSFKSGKALKDAVAKGPPTGGGGPGKRQV